MSLRRYVPSGRATPLAIVAVLVAAVIGGVVTGGVEAVIARWVSLFFVFPLFIGALAGAGASFAIRRGKLRAPAIALVLGVVGGAAGYFAEHVTEYKLYGAGAPSFVGFLELRARAGVTLKTEDYDPGLRLVGTQAWILWLAELLLSAGVAGALAYKRANEPFCESCENWFAREVTVQTNGAGTREMRKQLLAAIERGDVDAAAGAFFGPRPAKSPLRFHLTMRVCPRGGRGVGYFQLYQRRVRQQGQRRLAHWLMAEPDRERFAAALEHAMAARPAM
jgi:hypothetical protein